MMRWIITPILCGLHILSHAVVDTRAGAFDTEIATLQSRVGGMVTSEPVIVLGGDEVMVFEFDMLRPECEYLRYSLTHCDSDWQPSALVPNEFAHGFNEWDVTDYVSSRSTAIPYTHYRITISDPETKPKVSGNYLLKVYREDDPENVLAQYRFLVTEQSATIEATVSTNTDIDFNRAHQQVSAVVYLEHSGVRDPMSDLVLVVTQNDRQDNVATVRSPMKMLNSSTVVYRHLPELVFEAGNEYRRFEIVSNYHPNMGVETTDYHEPYYHYGLYVDAPRAEAMYLYDQTLRGGFVVRNEYGADADSEADYGLVHFALDCPESDEYDIYIDGDLTSRRFDDHSRMIYNAHTGMYERSLLLKQGAYSYQYLSVPEGGNKGTTAFVEGNFYQTANRYRLVVYARSPLDRYDRIIAVSETGSFNQ